MLAHIRPHVCSIRLILLARGWQRLTLATASAHIRAWVYAQGDGVHIFRVYCIVVGPTQGSRTVP